MLTATAALDPGCELTLLDGKYVELASWVGCAARTVGPDQDQAITVLRELVREMDDRYLTLVANRQRKIHQGDGWKLHTELSKDELKKLSDSINALSEPISKIAAVVTK